MIEVSLHKSLMGSEGKVSLQLQFAMPFHAIWAIMGPSGAGKTSVLKMLAGLMKPNQGHIYVDGQCWFDSQQQVWKKPQQRSIGFVFQDYALFPNMNVRQNLEYALPSSSPKNLIDEVLELMHMEKLQSQKPNKLSGGQQQRVALARAIIRQPQLLLLDEPFAALDRSMREKLQQDLLTLHQRFDTSILLVSHDAMEVARMADKVLELHQGQLIREANPIEILPVITEGLFEGEVVYVDKEQQYFVMLDRRVSGLLRFDSPLHLKIKKGDRIQVNGDQVNIQSDV
ncbi:ATP-binding cassette domain-containing protein [Catalinimonas niigatensis]|uniref:ATP-binding cassette domain-containing protein n=1 Tax=Catalinimonas niigatensis TaxID=1397264 RepID=UPI002666B67F|nr:ATP-binding cassette domain-containing protein [Catalinimonas niigatensis]WPP52799.1 ATP-binding cassette domain-containing protein [Catalinimonas niigatensis]